MHYEYSCNLNVKARGALVLVDYFTRYNFPFNFDFIRLKPLPIQEFFHQSSF